MEWEGPTIESTELYLKKSGGELPTQLFRFKDQGERDITVRPELTASLGRIAAAYQREYTKPLKWFEIGSCFRYEKPQKGRLREFYQFNADILGESEAGADAELIALAIDCMRELGFREGDFIVRLSDREVWLDYAAKHGIPEDRTGDFLAIVDKFERDRPEECQRKLDAFGMRREDLVAFIENPPADCSPRYSEVLAELDARGLAGYVKLDLSVVRGLAYYTGLVFEIFDSGRSCAPSPEEAATTRSSKPSPTVRRTCPPQASPSATPSSPTSSSSAHMPKPSATPRSSRTPATSTSHWPIPPSDQPCSASPPPCATRATASTSPLARQTGQPAQTRRKTGCALRRRRRRRGIPAARTQNLSARTSATVGIDELFAALANDPEEETISE